MPLNQSLAENEKPKPKGHLRYESLLKALPPDILRELANRKLEEIDRIRKQTEQATQMPLNAGVPGTQFSLEG